MKQLDVTSLSKQLPLSLRAKTAAMFGLASTWVSTLTEVLVYFLVPGFCSWALFPVLSWWVITLGIKVRLQWPPSSTLAGFIYHNYGPSPCKDLSHWTMIPWDDLQLNWLKLVYLGSQLGKGCKTRQSKWETYFNWHFEASTWVSNSQIASLQDTNSKISKANSELSQGLTNLKETT